MTFERLISPPGTLPEQMAALWARQAAEWPRLAEGLAQLRQARVKRFDLRGGTLMVQSNPGRMVSTGAKLDAATVAARPCFLCSNNLPVEQLGLAYGDKWLVLCNPAPIFEPHFVISSTQHEPQSCVAAIEVILDLARDLAGEYTVFYNGPRCGASAPDHLHVQAVRAGVLPFELELLGEMYALEGWLEPLRDHPVRVSVTRAPHRPAVVLFGANRDALAATLREVIAAIGQVTPAEPEPMLNLFALYSPEVWLVYLFPRRAHRPACYGQGPGQFVVSPGCIDVAGVLIAPRAEDFVRIDGGAAAGLLDEVLLAPEELARLRERLQSA